MINVDELNSYMHHQNSNCTVTGSEFYLKLKYKDEPIAYYSVPMDQLKVYELDMVFTKEIISTEVINLFYKKIKHKINNRKFFVKVLNGSKGFLSRKNGTKSEYILSSKRKNEKYQKKFTHDEIIQMRSEGLLNIDWNKAIIEEEK